VSEPIVLAASSIDAIARRLAEILRDEAARRGLVDAAALATELRVSRDFVYRHALELGGQRVGTGPRPRWRFDVDKARQALGQVPPAPTEPPAHPRRRRRAEPTDIDLLPIGPRRAR
jgi:hypothetical protein